MTLPTLLIICSTLVFLTLERVFPGRKLPHAPGWYARALLINLAQLGITVGMGEFWLELLGSASLLQLTSWNLSIAEGFVAWFVGTFIFYWWHRVRHVSGFWRIFHQVHHSPSRIEILTSFYKHPIEIFVNSMLSAVILYPLLGCSLIGAVWYNFFAATGEYFYHANLKTPKWLRYFIQTPELHSIHHELDVHRYNFSDIPIWDRLFGTYKDTIEFANQCGFPGSNETRLWEMLVFKDVYDAR